MKRLFLLVCLFLTVLIFGSSQVLAQVNYPEPKGYVNDFANIIPAEIEQRIEQNLRDYEAKTTNEIAVVTVNSLEGLSIEGYSIGLAEKWQVGKEGKDNGVILLVAPNEREVRIEVGYGLESVLTDARSKIILDRTIIPEFKKGDFVAGIEKGVAEIIKTITPPIVAATPVAQIKEVKFDSSAGPIFGLVIAIIVVIIGLIMLCVWLNGVFKRLGEERSRRESVRQKTTQRLRMVKDDLAQLLSEAQKLGEVDKKYPVALNKRQVELIADGNNLKELTETSVKEITRLLKKDPDGAWTKTSETQRAVSGFREKSRMLKAERYDFDAARQTHEKTFSKAVDMVQNTSAYLGQMALKGYAVSSEKELVAVNDKIKAVREILAKTDDAPDYFLAIKYADEATKKAKIVLDVWQRLSVLRESNNRNLIEMRRWYEEPLPALTVAYQKSLEELKTKTPAAVWEPISSMSEKVGPTAIAEFGTLLNTAERLNGMTDQKFEAAARAIEGLQRLKRENETLLAQPERTMQDFIQAPDEAKILAVQALNFISQAEKTASDSEASGAGRGKIKEAKDKVAEAEKLKKDDSPNWLLVVVVLTTAIALARAGEREAKDQIEEVENTRRRQREEERRKRRAKEEEERRRREEAAAVAAAAVAAAAHSHSSSSSYYSSSSSSSSFGGGFGGFGGGGFGGGGASGHF